MIRVTFTRPSGACGSVSVEHACDLVRQLAGGSFTAVPADAVWSARPDEVGHLACHHPQPVHDHVEGDTGS